MDHIRDHYEAWLRDAHAMEEQAQTILNVQLQRLENYPELSARIRQHLSETERQAAAIKHLLDARNSANSILKDAMGKMAATGQALGGMFTSDEVVKGSMASYTFEHMEIAAYRTLIAAARHLGDSDAIPVFEQILKEEIAMADWLAEHLPPTVQTFLARSEAELQAKR